jgi:hypothetical protein
MAALIVFLTELEIEPGLTTGLLSVPIFLLVTIAVSDGKLGSLIILGFELLEGASELS